MNQQQEINQLHARIELLKKQQENCEHVWSTPFYNAEKYLDEEIDWAAGLQPMGSDPYYNTRTVERYKPRWTRVCRKCGLEQHTYEQEVVDVKREPKFR